MFGVCDRGVGRYEEPEVLAIPVICHRMLPGFNMLTKIIF